LWRILLHHGCLAHILRLHRRCHHWNTRSNLTILLHRLVRNKLSLDKNFSSVDSKMSYRNLTLILPSLVYNS
jgi:hypothetical protein